jgi:hypothetical protein
MDVRRRNVSVPQSIQVIPLIFFAVDQGYCACVESGELPYDEPMPCTYQAILCVFEQIVELPCMLANPTGRQNE